METNYIKSYFGHTLVVDEDVADGNQDGLTGSRKMQRSWVVEVDWRMPRIEVAGDICLRMLRPTQGCRGDDDDE
jgi:hypothetical protein